MTNDSYACPFHEMPGTSTVVVRGIPVSAALACQTWHDTEGIRQYFREVIVPTLTGVLE